MREFSINNLQSNGVGVERNYGHEPLPEPLESAARMVHGDRSYNETLVGRYDFNGSLLHKMRQQPEIIARVRFLAHSRRQRHEPSRDSKTLSRIDSAH